jgi:hypothetical protein
MNQTIEPNHYILELDLSGQSSSSMRVYARGISPSLMNFESIQAFRILRYWLEEADYVKKNLTRRFLYLQRMYRKRLILRKKALSYLRRRELGLAHPNELSRYLE